MWFNFQKIQSIGMSGYDLNKMKLGDGAKERKW